MNRDEYIKVLKDYKSACFYLKQINSNKANKYSKRNNCLTISTVILTVVLSAIAFVDRITFVRLLDLEYSYTGLQVSVLDLCFNSLALFVLILTLINLLFRFQEKSSTYFHTVTTLSSMIRDIDFLLNIRHEKDEDFLDKFDHIQIKYNIILDYLPQHTDNEFVKAKYDKKVKDELSALIKNDTIPKWKLSIFRFSLKIYLKSDKKVKK